MASDPVIVIVGAGASHDCSPLLRGSSPRHIGWHEKTATAIHRQITAPPLTKDLFSLSYASIQDQYPAVSIAASEIEATGDTAIALEDFLRTTYASATDSLSRKKFAALPCYLQHLLHAATQWAYRPQNHDVLVSALLRLRQPIIFISLNYDVLLDQRLGVDDPLHMIDDYTKADRSWSLIKPHGSVNWGRLVKAEDFQVGNLFEPPEKIELEDDITVIPWSEDVATLRQGNPTNQPGVPNVQYGVYYPVVAVPLGANEDRILCPENHIAFLLEQLNGGSQIHVLMIGYSAIDQKVCQLLGSAERPIKTLCVVAESSEAADDAMSRLGRHVELDVGPGARLWGGYSSFVRDANGLDAFLSAIT